MPRGTRLRLRFSFSLSFAESYRKSELKTNHKVLAFTLNFCATFADYCRALPSWLFLNLHLVNRVILSRLCLCTIATDVAKRTKLKREKTTCKIAKTHYSDFRKISLLISISSKIGFNVNIT